MTYALNHWFRYLIGFFDLMLISCKIKNKSFAHYFNEKNIEFHIIINDIPMKNIIPSNIRNIFKNFIYDLHNLIKKN